MGVLVRPEIAIDISAKLTELGGTAEAHEVPEEAVAEADEAAPAVEQAQIAAGDDLSILDGVGPTYANALKAGGVTTFAALSQDTPESISEILVKQNQPLIAGHTADTWPRQAKLAAAQEWSALRRNIDSTKKVSALSRPELPALSAHEPSRTPLTIKVGGVMIFAPDGATTVEGARWVRTRRFAGSSPEGSAW